MNAENDVIRKSLAFFESQMALARSGA
jgi:hypothetical protein